MAGKPVARLLPDGRRLHLQHGPIDLIIEAFGPRSEIDNAYSQAWARFRTVLPELVEELPLLRRAIDHDDPGLRGPVAQRMFAACRPHRANFITPMAAVAGSVADEVMAAMIAGRTLDKAYINNGGDIALHLPPHARLEVGLVANLAVPMLNGIASIEADWPVRGIATSGWRGRSFSLGIADSATILAADAATADAAATVVANAVDIDHPAIARARACDLRDDTDLGDRLVTTAVGALPPEAVDRALDRGIEVANALHGGGVIFGALLALQGKYRSTGAPLMRIAAAA
jgi:ApbE superfamily uncharacterized protein (UPF0280 family)